MCCEREVFGDGQSGTHGVMMRSITGSSAVLMSSVSSPTRHVPRGCRAPPPRPAWVMPIPAKTTANGSPPAWACAAICVAQLEVRNPPTEKTAASGRAPCGQHVDDGDAGEDRVARSGPGRVGSAEHRIERTCRRRPEPPSSGVPRPLHTRPSHASLTPIRIGWPGEAHRGAVRGDPRCALEHLDHGQITIAFQDEAVAYALVVEEDLGVFIPTHTIDTSDDEEGSFHPTDVCVLDRSTAAHG